MENASAGAGRSAAKKAATAIRRRGMGDPSTGISPRSRMQQIPLRAAIAPGFRKILESPGLCAFAFLKPQIKG
jgi:hypothetical protein